TFVADVVLHVDTRPAAAEDRLDLTADYGVLAEQVGGVLEGEPADLVESVAERIAAVALTHPAVPGADVVLHERQAPLTAPYPDLTVQIHRALEPPPVVAGPAFLAPAAAHAALAPVTSADAVGLTAPLGAPLDAPLTAPVAVPLDAPLTATLATPLD